MFNLQYRLLSTNYTRKLVYQLRTNYPKSLSTSSRTLQTFTQQETITPCLLFILQSIYLHKPISAHVFTANHITYLPTATLSWKKCYMKCGVWNQLKIWSSHLLDNLSNCLPLSHLNFSGSWDNCLNCPASARIISSVDFKHRTSYNTSFILHSFHGKTWAQQIDLLSTVWLHSSVG